MENKKPEEKEPFVPSSFVAQYKPTDNRGNRNGIFQELVEGECVFICIKDSQVGAAPMHPREKAYVSPIEGHSLVDAATTLMKVGIRGSWTDDARERIMEILDLPSTFVVTNEENS